jgi:hypothetical protein
MVRLSPSWLTTGTVAAGDTGDGAFAILLTAHREGRRFETDGPALNSSIRRGMLT